MAAITIAGYDRESICCEVRRYACKLRDRVIPDDTFVPVLYDAEPGEEWRDEKVWTRTNHGLGA